MRVLIKSATVIQERSPHHLQQRDILINDGHIERIEPKIDLAMPADEVFDHEGQHVSCGWTDLGCYIGEPGEERHELLESVSRAALQGGFTRIAPFSNNTRPFQTKSDIQAIANDFPVIHPIGALTENLEGRHLTEYLDLHRYGVRAFSDGLNHVYAGGTLLRALQYAVKEGDWVIHAPSLLDLHGGGLINEGRVSAAHGMTGFPAAAEEITLKRDLKLLEYSGSKLLAHLVTLDSSVDEIGAHRDRLNLRASVSGLQLAFTDAVLSNFNSDFKVLPVLRTEQHRRALISAVADGVIDIISSNHYPVCDEEKDLEFPRSAFGSTGLVSVFGVSRKSTREDVELPTLIRCFTSGPREILDIDEPVIDKGSPADLTIFDPDTVWTYDAKYNHSKSSNAALYDRKLTGRALGVVLNNRFERLVW